MGGVTDNLLQPEGFTRPMQGFSVDPDSTVVVYDYKYDETRVWWAFYHSGETDVRLLCTTTTASGSAGPRTTRSRSSRVART